jgi:hypothetical protein
MAWCGICHSSCKPRRKYVCSYETIEKSNVKVSIYTEHGLLQNFDLPPYHERLYDLQQDAMNYKWWRRHGKDRAEGLRMFCLDASNIIGSDTSSVVPRVFGCQRYFHRFALNTAKKFNNCPPEPDHCLGKATRWHCSENANDRYYACPFGIARSKRCAPKLRRKYNCRWVYCGGSSNRCNLAADEVVAYRRWRKRKICKVKTYTNPVCMPTRRSVKCVYSGCPVNHKRNTTSGDGCAFPFKAYGKHYCDCTSRGHHTAWCVPKKNKDKWDAALESFNNLTHYEATKLAMAARPQLWQDCNGPERKTTDGRKCVIPFTFKGKTYNDCATKCQPWCPTDSADASNLFRSVYTPEFRKNRRGVSWGSCAPRTGDWSTFGAQ